MSLGSMKERTAALGGAGAAVAAARVVSLLAAAVQLPILTRALPPGEYGAIAVAMSIATYFALVTSEPATLAFQRHPGSDGNRGNYAHALSKILPTVAIGGVTVVTIGLLSGGAESAIGIVAWGLSLALARYTATAWLMWHRSWSYTLNLMASTVARTAMLVGLVVSGVSGPVALIMAGAVSAAVSLILAPRASIRRQDMPAKPWPRSLGYLLAAASLGVTVLGSANVILLEHKVGPASTASFAAMSQLALLTSGAVASTVLTVIYPSLRRQWDAGEHEHVLKSVRVTQLLMVTIAGASVAAFTAFDGAIAGLIVEPSIVDVPTLCVLLIATTIGAIGQTAGWLLQFRLEPRKLAQRTAIASLVALALLIASIWTVPTDPARVAAIATAIGFTLYASMLRGRASVREPTVTVLVVALMGVALAVLFLPTTAIAGAAAAVSFVAVTVLVLQMRKKS